MPDYIQKGPSCDLDAHGDPQPPKVVRATFDGKPLVRRIDRKRPRKRGKR